MASSLSRKENIYSIAGRQAGRQAGRKTRNQIAGQAGRHAD